jgi:hypothetical protein
MSSKVMATGVIADLGGGLPQVAREMTMLLQGRAGAHNVFGATLGFTGDKAKEFNKMTGPERVKALDAVLDKYGQSISVFETSWDAVSGTFIDSIKVFAQTATAPLFEKVKDQLREANLWFDANKESVQRYAEIIGMRLGEAWDFGKAKVLEWGPVFLEFVDNGSRRLKEIWTEIEPGVTRIGELIQDALRDPGTIDKMITLVKLWAGLKGAQAGLGMAGSAIGMGKGLWGMGGGAMAFGGKVATATAASAGVTATAGVGASVAGLALAAGSAALALGAWAVAADQAIKLVGEINDEEAKSRNAIVGAIGREIEAMDQIRGLENPALSTAESLNETSNEAGESARKLREFQKWGAFASEEARAFADQLGVTGITLQDTDIAALELKSRLYDAAAAAQSFAAAADARLDSIININPAGTAGIETLEKLGMHVTAAESTLAYQTSLVNKALADPNFLKAPGGAEQGASHKGGGGGTKVQKVEIVVTSNQNPSRIAREVVDYIGHLNRTAKASKYAPNFSGVSKG